MDTEQKIETQSEEKNLWKRIIIAFVIIIAIGAAIWLGSAILLLGGI